ncbi:tetratricopeptide (TPR) repeat protein [Povalibacter uvarum]|uniref:Tetratricopeptide (TPR) repeat protein n=1 Tax=Povalibacter uvarum TaxID=732238 RepID=A0A841HQP2_9GAMM|nr:tetratricopeptide repeat protein [Povalibacter uvarum]MBB6095196.1 tetratricopeptide (TPR) repeat protein [Povalibacter uvarum]
MISQVVAAFSLVLASAAAYPADLIDLFATRDQQGRWYFERGDYKTAAQRFTDPQWKGTALYRAGDYANALAEFSKLDTADGYFMQGNAQARMHKYEAAVKSYDNALQSRSEFPEAKNNRGLVAALIPKPDEESDEEAPDLPPDQVKFDEKGKRGKEKTMSAGMIRKQTADLWMKNLQVSPADFLRHKFEIEAEATK